MTVLMARMRGALASIVGGIAGVLVGPTTITTSTASTATAYSNQRKIDRCQNGVLWAIAVDFKTFGLLRYSTDNGATWTAATTIQLTNDGLDPTTTPYQGNVSMFIDLDDYMHIVYKSGEDGYIYYRRGTPNAARTAWTWSAALQIENYLGLDHPDIVAHREGTGWRAHIVVNYQTGTPTTSTFYFPVTITSAGVISKGSVVNLTVGTHNHNVSTYPSIDFNHTGDAKTVAGGTPHLYAAWSAGATGAGKGIRLKKATYSAGAWTWGTEREIDSTRYVLDENWWLNCLFDGTRVAVVGVLRDSGGNNDIVVHDRDVADTTTTTTVLVDNAGNAVMAWNGTATYDGNGNVWVFGRYNDGAQKLAYRKWTRSGASLGVLTNIDTTSISASPYVTAKRGYSNNRIEFIYTDGTASPYDVVYGGIE